MTFCVFAKGSEKTNIERVREDIAKRDELLQCLTRINEVSLPEITKNLFDYIKAGNEIICGEMGTDGKFVYYNKTLQKKKSPSSGFISGDALLMKKEILEAVVDLENGSEVELRKVASKCELPVIMRVVACKKIVEIMTANGEELNEEGTFNGAREKNYHVTEKVLQNTKVSGEQAVSH